MIQDYGTWPESKWVARDIDWQRSGVITAGVDVGAAGSKAVIMCDDKLYSYALIRTSSDSAGSARKAIDRALEGTGLQLSEIRNVVGTGCGRKNIAFAKRTVDEITCHVKGASYIYGPSVRTVVDMGGQTVKAAKCSALGKITELFINDKCATGMGREVETMANLLEIPIQDIGELSLSVKDDPEPVSTTCSIFANSQAIGMLRAGNEENEVLAAYLFGIAFRIYTLAGRLKVEKEVAFTGGLAKNPGVAKRLERELGLTVPAPKYDTQLAGAIGAALLANELATEDS